MDNRTLVRVTDSLKKQRSRKRWHKTVGFMGLVVLAATVAALVIPASTLAKEPSCGLEEHIHTESCYTETPVLSCGLEAAPAHSHTDACYAESSKLVCGLEESEEHSHTDSCYAVEKVLVCGQTEHEGHVHSDACYTKEQILSCGKPEHTHEKACYDETAKREEASAEEAADSSAEETAELQGDPTADVETRADWEATLSGITRTGNWAEDVLAVAGSQLGYQESSRNFVTDENGKQKGYSRYGAWYGDAYGDWCAMFASFCLYYADIPADQMPEEASCPRWIYRLAMEKRYASVGKYDPRPGDLIFFDEDQDGTADHVGIVYVLDGAKGKIKTIEGNSNDMVQYVTYGLDDEKIVGYGILPENPELVQSQAAVSGQSYYYEDDAIGAVVTLPEDTDVPADARLRVTAITEKNDDYDTLAEQAEGAVSGEPSEIALYDISFYTEDDEYISVTDQAQVALWFKETLNAGADQDVSVLHFDGNEEAPVALEQVKATKDIDDNVSLVTFETSGFSVFAVVTVTSGNYGEYAVNNLDGKSFAIVGMNENKALTADKVGITVGGMAYSGLKGAAVTTADVNGVSYVDADAPLWTFHKTNTSGVYTISTVVDGKTVYLNFGNLNYGQGGLATSSNPQNITVSWLEQGGVTLGYRSGFGYSSGYINADHSSGHFWSYNNSGDANCAMTLCIPANLSGINLSTNLDGIKRADGSSLSTGGSWDSKYQPNLDGAAVQSLDLTDDGVLPSLSGTTDQGRFVYYGTTNRYLKYNNNSLYKTGEDSECFADESKVWGKEYLFDHWEAADESGKIYSFPDGAAYTVNKNKSITLEDVDGEKRTIPSGTMITASYREFSDLVIFSVNYKGTILDTSGNISVHTEDTWTPVVVVGHVYNPETVAGKDNTYAVEANSTLTGMFRSKYDPKDQGAQIVVDGFITSSYTVTSDTTTLTAMPTYTKAHGATPDQVAEHLMKVLKDNKATIWLNSAKDPAPTVETDNLDTEHYNVRWYVLKETSQTTDAWHIDGILVAKTEPLRVTKEFHGLENAKNVEDALAKNFEIQVSLQKQKESIPYFDVVTNNDSFESTAYGMYEYNGKQGNVHQWTVNVIKGEPFVFTEASYQDSAYDCATVITVRYTDGRAEQLFKNKISVNDIKGGEVESVAFDNFYTPKETGMLYIHKYAVGIADNILDSALAGADFEMELTKADGSGPVRVTSDSNGTVFFNELQLNTEYKLKETKAPSGFVTSGKTWTISVGSNKNNVKVTDAETGEVLYQTTDGISKALNIGNTPDTDTLTVTKRFTGDITTAQVEAMKDYRIVLTGTNADGKEETYTLTQAGVTDEDGKSAGTVSVAGGMFFTWQILEVTGTEYQVREEKYLPDSASEDTLVSVSAAPIDSQNTQVGAVTVDRKAGAAVFTATLRAKQSDAFAVTNNYVDSFALEVKKVDRNAGKKDVPLSGAQFKVYGPYLDSADPSDTVVADGTTYYYHGTTAETVDGVVRYTVNDKNKELKLGSAYVLVESKAPGGYILDAAALPTGVVNRENENYSNGVYTMTVVNGKKFTVEVEKRWEVSDESKMQPVTIHLWSRVNGEERHVDNKELRKADNWKCSWEVPLYDEDGNQYEYFVVEDYIPGYSASYSTERDVLSDGETVAEVALDEVESGESLKTKIIITNTEGGELPSAGGAGTHWFTFGGIALLLMAIYVLIKPRRRREAD